MTDKIYHLDVETCSKLDLKKVGAYKYAEHPSTHILMVAVARDGEEPHIYVPMEVDRNSSGAIEILHELASPDAVIYAHNAAFERAVTEYCWGRDIPFPSPRPHQWRCTAVMARKAGLASSLDTLGTQLDIGEAKKDKIGDKLIKLFSIGLASPEEYPEEWEQFKAYCLQDVRAEMAVHEKLRRFELTGPLLEAFQLDARINHRGFPVNLEAIRRAQPIIDRIRWEANLLFDVYTDGLMITQRAKFLAWLQERGYPYKDLQALTREKALNDTSWTTVRGVLEAFLIYDGTSFAAIDKLAAMERFACSDGMVRGGHYFYGAGTGRWSAKGVQIQNAKRSTGRGTELYRRLLAGNMDLDDLGPVAEVLSESIRHFIQPERGAFLDVDYTGIEARIAPWIAGQEDMLDAYRKGEDLYVRMGAKVYHKKEADVLARHKAGEYCPERVLGKTLILGAQFGIGGKRREPNKPSGFEKACIKAGINISIEECENAINTYRREANMISSMWSGYDSNGYSGGCITVAVKNAWANPGEVFHARMLSFGVTRIAGMIYLLMKLPSGRSIAYPRFRVDDDGKFSYFAQDHFDGKTYKQKSGFDGRKGTYAGSLFENAVQGTAFDLMAHGAVKAEEAGYEICALIHDQCLAYGENESDLAELITCLTDKPDWAAGLPLSAEGSIQPFYTKS